MSDSDDTDVLLLIPPDFFLVHSSDSEDSICSEKYTDKHDFERLVVNDLISQVNELENRICVIENKNIIEIPLNPWNTSHREQTLEYSSSLGSSGYRYLRFKELPVKPHSMIISGHKFGGSTDNFKTHQTSNKNLNSLYNTPVKRKPSSLPSTPSVDISRNSIHSLVNFSKQDAEGLSRKGKKAITIERMTPSEILSMSHPVSDINVPTKRVTPDTTQDLHNDQRTPQKKGTDLIGEIDQFLDSVKKNSNPQISRSEHYEKEKPYICGDNSASVPDFGFGLRDFRHLPVREEPVTTRYIQPLEKHDLKQFKQLHPGELEQFLRDISDSSRNVDFPDKSNQQRQTYDCGDNVNSVPNLGFGLRSFNSLPVREEPIKPKTVTPLESYTLTPEMKGLELSDIEKLLKQMETTQYEIEKKLQLREAILGKSNDSHAVHNDIPPSRNTYVAGNNIGSVPDRGFGIRDLLYSSASVSNTIGSGDGLKVPEHGAKPPVHEDLCTKKNMYTVGSDVPPQESNNTHNSLANNHNKQLYNTVKNNSQQENPNIPIEEHMSKVNLAKRKLELGGDAATVPDLGFGLKSWYQSQENQSNTHLHPPHNFSDSNNTADATDGNNHRLADYGIARKDTGMQGDYLPSIPDLGFGIRSLWSSENTLESTASSFIPRTHSSLQAANSEHSLLSQKETSKVSCQSHDQTDSANTQNQSSQLGEGQRESGVIEEAVKKKVDFNVGSGKGDTLLVQQDYAHGQQMNEAGIRSKQSLQNSIPDSGLATSISSGSGNLLSLSELWGKESSAHSSQIKDEPANIRVKLEEEKYRRQHCERLIHQLQSRLLEEQQKLAVAVRVDKGKDQAILQLQEAWNRLVHHWKELEENRHGLANKLQSEREANQRLESQRAQKIKQLESELSKVLDLAQGYKEKYDSAEKEKSELTQSHNSEMKELMGKIQDIEQQLNKADKLHNQLIKEKNECMEKVKEAEKDAQTERRLLMEAQKELESMHKKLESFEAEISALKEEKETIQLKLKEEKGRNNVLDQQKKSIQTAFDEIKKKEKSVREEMKQLTSQMEKMKVELREYYQEQLEVVVREKLQEFQEQLDAAESGLHKELEQREQAITEIASKQVKQISEKHQLEVQLLEEKHTEELHLYKLQLAQAMQQITQLEAKLQLYNSRKSEIVEKLHNVMETQWQEALRIISGNSPLINNGAQHSSLQRGVIPSKIGTMPCPSSNRQLTGLEKAESFLSTRKNDGWGPNKEKIAKMNKIVTSTPHNFQVASSAQTAPQFQVPPIHLRDQSAGSSTAEESPFCQDGVLTYRMAEQQTSLQETPPSKDCVQKDYEHELKKYIMMLLNRSPGNPVNDETDPNDELSVQSKTVQRGCQRDCTDVPTNDASQLPKWEKILKQETQSEVPSSKQQSMPFTPAYDSSKAGQSSTKDSHHLKPPWK